MSLGLGIIFALIAMFAYGASDLLLTQSSRKIGEYRTLLWRAVLLFFILLAVTISVEGTLRVPLSSVPLIIAMGLLGIGGYYSLSKALKVGVVSVISPFTHSAVLLTVLLAFIFLGERLSMLQSLALGLIIIGMVFISVDHTELKSFRIKRLTKGMGYAVLTFFSWGVFSLLFRLVIDRVGPYIAAFYLEVVGLGVLLLAIPFSSRVRMKWKEAKTVIWLSLVLALGDIAQALAIAAALLAVVTPIIYSASLVSIVLAVIFLKERLTHVQKAAALFIILGIILISV